MTAPLNIKTQARAAFDNRLAKHPELAVKVSANGQETDGINSEPGMAPPMIFIKAGSLGKIEPRQAIEVNGAAASVAGYNVDSMGVIAGIVLDQGAEK
jgi:hypothetical protein